MDIINYVHFLDIKVLHFQNSSFSLHHTVGVVVLIPHRLV